MRRWRPTTGSGGFTLIELVVALGIMVVLGLMSYRVLATLVDTRERTVAAQGRWQDVTRVVQRLEVDLQQTALMVPGALSFDPPTQGLRIIRLAPTAAGDDLRTVYYRLRDGALEREERRGAGAATLAAPRDAAASDRLLEQVAAFEFAWPALQQSPGGAMSWQAAPSEATAPLPAAVRLRLRIAESPHDLVRVFALK